MYKVDGLSKLAGVSPRTLRYYHSIGLLNPCKIDDSGYRFYGEAEVERLQQIRLYKRMGFSLKAIQSILDDGDFDAVSALEAHRMALLEEKKRLDVLIDTVERSIEARRGGRTMKDGDKFKGLKEKMLSENEVQYGEEIRAKYGEAAVNASVNAFKGMSEETFHEMQALGASILEALAEAVATEDNAFETRRKIGEMHRRWIEMAWGHYDAQAHKGLGEMYIADDRFKAYYDKAGAGCANYLKTAIDTYVQAL